VKRRWPKGTPLTSVSLLILLGLAAMCVWPVAAQETETGETPKKKPFIRFCVDQWNLPLSDNNPVTPGADIEFTWLIATKLGSRASYHWTNTNLGGVRRAMAESIGMNKCDCFVGIPTWANLEEEMSERSLVMTEPYYGTGYVLAVRKGDTTTSTLEDLREKRIGVVMGQVGDWYLFKNGYNRVIYRRPEDVLQAITDGEVDGALLWATISGWRMLEHADEYDAKFVEGYVPFPELRLDVAMAVRAEDMDLKEALDRAIGELTSEGEVERIFRKYGIPYYPPFRDRK